MPIIIKTSISEMRIAVARVLPQLIDETADAVMNNIEQDTKRQHRGRIYPSKREPGATHQASAPGESFATDTESLVGSMKKERLSPLTTEIQFPDGRWALFEFGGSRIAPRPTIVPVMENMNPQFQHNVLSTLLEALTEQAIKS